MSKSIGNVVNPHELSSQYQIDGLRYFLLREGTLGSDGSRYLKFFCHVLLNIEISF